MKTRVVAQTVPSADQSSLSIWRAAAAVVGFAALTAVSGQVAIPLPFTPVPITVQTLVVSLAGITLGWKLGAASMAFYLLLGTAGYHVFAGGNWGLATVAGATGGYLLGFLLAQPVFALLASRPMLRWYETLGVVLAGHAVIFAAGVSWLAVWLGVDLPQALVLGFWPFLPGCALKTAGAVLLARPLQRTIRPRLFS